MKKVLVVALLAFTQVVPAVAKTHKDTYNMPCKSLWVAVKDVLRNSGKYGIIGISSEEMTASYNIGGNLTGKRVNSLVLNPSGSGCELQIQTAMSGLVNNDYGDFRKRLDEALTRPQPAPAETPAPAAEAPAAPAPVAAAPAPAAQASITVQSSVPGADIEVDGSFVGSTPSTLNLAPGQHSIVVKKKGYQDWKRDMNVSTSGVHINADLEPAPGA